MHTADAQPDLHIRRDHCEDEPIRFVDAIQPTGILLCIDVRDRTILAASANHRENPVLRGPLVGRSLSEIWPALAAACRHGTFMFGDDLMVHCHSDDETLFVEIEACTEADGTGIQDMIEMGAVLTRIQEARTLETVTRDAAAAIRWVTGMERVLVYRFDKEGHGEVMAESKVDDWTQSFIGFHFPSADIPSQARALYLISPCRFVERRDYEPVPVVPDRHPRTGRPFDLGRCRLRSLSPMHRLYQENLGVDGAMSISIIDGGQLWGLVVGHHRSPHRVPIPAREQAMAVTTSLAMRLAATESADDRAARERHVILHAKLLEQIAGADDFVSPLVGGQIKLADMFFTSGSLVVVDGADHGGDAEPTVYTVGLCPDRDLIVAFCQACRSHMDDGIFHTDHAASVLPAFAAHAEYASGVLAAALGEQGRHMVLWFRPETIRTISWGGASPEQVEKEKAAGNYLPRTSFARWVEELRGHSLPWQRWQIDIARSLRAALNDLTIRQMRNARNLEINVALRRANAVLQARTRELEAANAALIQARERAEAANRAKAEFLAVMNHEFHTPLNAIIGFAEVLTMWESQAPTDPRLAACSHRIVEGGRALLALLDDILSLSRMAAGDLNLQFGSFPVSRLITNAVAAVAEQAEASHVHLVSDGQDTSWWIDGDEEALLKALIHILRNGVKFTHRDGKVDLRTHGFEDGHLEIVVADDGIGIAAADLEKVMSPFMQADGSETRQYNGAGIGLPLAQKLIECHGGTVTLESRIGHGTTVTLSIPKERVIQNSSGAVVG